MIPKPRRLRRLNIVTRLVARTPDFGVRGLSVGPLPFPSSPSPGEREEGKG